MGQQGRGEPAHINLMLSRVWFGGVADRAHDITGIEECEKVLCTFALEANAKLPAYGNSSQDNGKLILEDWIAGV